MTEPFTPGPDDRDDTGHLGPDFDNPHADGPETGPDPSSRRTTILLAVSALAAVAIVIAAILIATSGSDDSPVAAGSSSSAPTTETVTVTPSTTEETTTEETTTTTEETTTEDSTSPESTEASGSAGKGREAVVYDCAGRSQVRPTDITSIYCGDDAVSLTNLEWTRWGSREAVGTGTEVRKVCNPNCAQGSTVGSQVQVTLGDVSKKSFTTVTVIGEDGATKSYQLTGRAPN